MRLTRSSATSRRSSAIAAALVASAAASASSTGRGAPPIARSTSCPSGRTSARAAARPPGCAAVEVIPMGPRKARADGVPLQSYRRDELSASYRRRRAARRPSPQRRGAGAARSGTRRSPATSSRRTATSSSSRTASIAAWSTIVGPRGRCVLAGTLIAAIDREARAVAAIAGGAAASSARRRARPRSPSTARAVRASTSASPIAFIDCPTCGLRGDRDAVAAVLASFVVLVDNAAIRRRHASTTTLQPDALDEIRRVFVFSVSWGGKTPCPSQPTSRPAMDRSSRGRRPHPTLSRWLGEPLAWHRAQPGMRPGVRRTTSDRARVRTNMSSRYAPSWTYLRDTS